MENLPPHLPRKSCNVRDRQIFNYLSGFLFFVFVSVLTSVALTLTTLVWVAPTFIPEQLITNIQSKNLQTDKEDLSADVLNKVKQQVWYIYDKRQKIDNQFYSYETDRVQAVMFSSDGWAVAYAPNYRKGAEKFWEGVDYQGTSYAIEKIVVDSVSDLIYIKFAGDGFPFISFANWNNIGAGSEVFAVSMNKREKYVLEKSKKVNNEQIYPVWRSQFFYHLPDVFENSSLVINKNGELVGLVDENNNIIYGWLMDNQYVFILQNGNPNYRAISWDGRMVYGFIKENDLTKHINGFYVNNSPTRATASTVGAGDLIIKIQNKEVDAEDLARQILLAPEKFSVIVWRNGKEVEIIAEKINVDK